MDLNLTDQQQILKRAARDLLEREWPRRSSAAANYGDASLYWELVAREMGL